MKYFKNIYSISFFIILIFFLSADKKIENIYNNNFYISIVFLLSIIYLIYNKNNVNIFLLIMLVALYFNSDMKNRFNYEYFNNKFESTSMKTIKDKLENLSNLYYSNNNNDNKNKENKENSNQEDKNIENIDKNNVITKNDKEKEDDLLHKKEDELIRLFNEVEMDIKNIGN